MIHAHHPSTLLSTSIALLLIGGLLGLTGTARAADDDADEFWDSGPVDRTIQISGALMASSRLTAFANNSDQQGSDELTFQIEHTHLKFLGDLTNKLSYEITPCLTHMDSFSVLTANFTYAFSPAIQLTAGRFLMPFGGFNLRSLPGGYASVSRPLLYQSHEDRTVGFDTATPQDLFFTPRDDIGLLASGSAWMGSDDQIQLWYGGWISNGPRVDSSTTARHWDDNNNAKAIGARGVISVDLDPLDFALGGSGIVNSYRDADPDAETVSLWEPTDQIMWSADFELGYRWGASHRFELLGEYTHSHQQIVPTDLLAAGDWTIQGWYVEADTMLSKKLGVVAEFDHLENLTWPTVAAHLKRLHGFLLSRCSRLPALCVQRHAAPRVSRIADNRALGDRGSTHRTITDQVR